MIIVTGSVLANAATFEAHFAQPDARALVRRLKAEAEAVEGPDIFEVAGV